MIKNFVNLTNGIEAISFLDEWNIVRICSTTIEKKDWLRLFVDLDHNLLFWLSQSAECRIYDFGAGRENSKTIKVGVPLIKRMLEYAWFGKPWDGSHLLERADTAEKRHLKRKMGYYRQIIRTHEVSLYGFSRRTNRDGDIEYYRAWLANTLVQ